MGECNGAFPKNGSSLLSLTYVTGLLLVLKVCTQYQNDNHLHQHMKMVEYYQTAEKVKVKLVLVEAIPLSNSVVQVTS